MLSSLNSKFELQCRLCGNFKNTSELLHVENSKSIELNLEYKISQCLPIEFSNAYLPKHVCLHCCEKVSSTYDFRQDVIKAQQVLKPIITDTQSIKSEISNVSIRNDPGENCSEDEKPDGDDDSDFGKPLSVIKVSFEKYLGMYNYLDLVFVCMKIAALDNRALFDYRDRITGI